MNKSITLTPTPAVKILISVEGNDLVQHTFSVDVTKPRMWVDGCEYKFNTNLVDTVRVSGKRIPAMMAGATL
jgi:hypothetical protein